jgi:homoserine dehydrogenase
LKIGGANNALLMYEGKDGENGIYSVSGPGAGAEPTTASMILDLEKLLGGNKK